MGEDHGGRLAGHLHAILQPLNDEVASIEMRRSEILAEIAAYKAERMREVNELEQELRGAQNVLRAAERALNPVPRIQVKGKSRRSHQHTSEDTIARIISTMREGGDRTWTTQELSDVVGLHKSTVQYALKDLRDAQQIRLLGRRRLDPEEKGPPPNHYTLMPEVMNGDES